MAINDDRTAVDPRIKLLGRAACVVVVLLIIGATAMAMPRMLDWMVQAWVVTDRVQAADAAVVLGGGYETRPAAAAQLYKEGRVTFILVSTGGMVDGAVPDIDRQALLKFGVPATAIIEFGNNPVDTYQEACALAAWAKRNHLVRVIVPTELFSSRRVRWILRRELGKIGVDARIETLTPKFYSDDGWWHSKTGIGDFSIEILKYLYYRIRYWRS